MNNTKIVKILNQGGIVIFPTDTAFGIGCRVDKENSIKKLFKIRKRPNDKAVPVLASSIRMIKDYVEELDPDVKLLMKKHWPGGLTIIVNCKKNKVSSLVTGGTNKIGFRIPDHRTTRDMIRSVGVPILGPSANFSGLPTPFKFPDLDDNLIKLVDDVVRGRCRGGKSSTVIDVTSKPWKILRPGAVTIKI